jgi:hypothetical protein
MNCKFSISLIGLLFVGAVGTATAQTTGPSADYELDSKYTVTSPDGTTTIEQYAKTAPDGDMTFQSWARHQDKQTMLAPEQPDYGADFKFTSDSQWVLRMQKTGSGEMSLYLYRLGQNGFVTATTKPLDELAWNYFYSRSESRKVRKPDFHMMVGLVKGLDDNYASIGEKWPDNRYVVLTLWGEVSPNNHHGQISSVRGWHCRYDLQTGKFDVPSDFAANNAKAIAPSSD